MIENSLGSDYLLVPPSVSLWGTNVGARPGFAEDLRAVDGVECQHLRSRHADHEAGWGR
jgi:putative ABC transport system permease protein